MPGERGFESAWRVWSQSGIHRRGCGTQSVIGKWIKSPDLPQSLLHSILKGHIRWQDIATPVVLFILQRPNVEHGRRRIKIQGNSSCRSLVMWQTSSGRDLLGRLRLHLSHWEALRGGWISAALRVSERRSVFEWYFRFSVLGKMSCFFGPLQTIVNRVDAPHWPTAPRYFPRDPNLSEHDHAQSRLQVSRSLEDIRSDRGVSGIPTFLSPRALYLRNSSSSPTYQP